MRVQRIGLYSNDKEVATFDTDRPNHRNPYILKAVDGLDAEQITPKFYGQGLATNANFTGLALEPREVVMRIGLRPNWRAGGTPADLRGNLQRAIASSRTGLVQLRFYDDEVVAGVLDGFIAKFNAPVSTKDSDVFITVKCENPLIRSMNPTGQVVEDVDLSDTVVINDPVSTAPHGLYLKFTFTGGASSFIMSEPGGSPDWSFQLDYAFLTGDELYISSDENNKYVYRVRSAVALHLADVIALGSIWPIMFPGENEYHIEDDTVLTLNEWYWYETHWGV
jgi:hypothetical protein